MLLKRFFSDFIDFVLYAFIAEVIMSIISLIFPAIYSTDASIVLPIAMLILLSIQMFLREYKNFSIGRLIFHLKVVYLKNNPKRNILQSIIKGLCLFLFQIDIFTAIFFKGKYTFLDALTKSRIINDTQDIH